MGSVTIQQMADRIAGLMEERLRVRGRGLSEKLRRGGRSLPRKVRDRATFLAEAAEAAGHPKLAMMIDEEEVARAYDLCLRHLRSVGGAERIWRAVLGVAGSVVFALLVVAGLFIAVLVWRGLI